MGDADAVIAALRSGHDGLAGLVAGLTDDDLARPSGAAGWDVSQALSHLGSGAEIAAATVGAAIDGKPHPGREFARPVWDRWDAMRRRERADGSVRSSGSLTALFESLDAGTRENLRIDLGFTPAPVDVALAARYWLSELTLHSWDVRAGSDPAAALPPDAAEQLMPLIDVMVSFLGKPERLDGAQSVIAVTTTGPARTFALRLGKPVRVEPGIPGRPDGTLTLPAEAWIRLATGRLGPRHTPAGVTAAGTAGLDLLRRVFPGY